MVLTATHQGRFDLSRAYGKIRATNLNADNI